MEDIQFDSFYPNQMKPTHAVTFQGQQYVLTQYERGRNLGTGAYSDVYQVRQLYSLISNQHKGRELVLKQMKASMPQSEYTKNLFQKQIDALLHLKDLHFQKYFITLEDYWKDQIYFYLIFQKCTYGSLSELLAFCREYNKPLKKDHIIYIIYSILRALQALHSSNIIHQDIKPQNIMFDDSLCLKLIDFGVSSKSPEGQQLIGQIRNGTVRYMAPQLLQRIPVFSQNVDVWSLGVILYYIIFSAYPIRIEKDIQGKSQDQICKIMQEKISNTQIDFTLNRQMKRNEFCQLIELIKLMLQKNKKQRKKAKEVLAQPIFKNIKDVAYEQNIRQDLKSCYSAYFNRKMNMKYKWRQVETLFEIKQIPEQLISRLKNKNKVQVKEVLHIDKFGFFLLLSNNNLLACFNDHSQLNYSEAIKEQIQEYEQRDKDRVNRIKILLYVQDKYFKQKMQNLQQDILTNQRYNQQYSRMQFCSIHKIFFHKSSLFVRLSNKTLQVFFENNKPIECQKQQRFISRCLTFNNDSKQPERINFRKNDKIYEYANYKDALKDPSCSQYIDFVRKVFSLILDNSSISLQKYGYQSVREE